MHINIPVLVPQWWERKPNPSVPSLHRTTLDRSPPGGNSWTAAGKGSRRAVKKSCIRCGLVTISQVFNLWINEFWENTCVAYILLCGRWTELEAEFSDIWLTSNLWFTIWWKQQSHDSNPFPPLCHSFDVVISPTSLYPFITFAVKTWEVLLWHHEIQDIFLQIWAYCSTKLTFLPLYYNAI